MKRLAEIVSDRPVLDHLAILDPPNVDLLGGELLARGRLPEAIRRGGCPWNRAEKWKGRESTQLEPVLAGISTEGPANGGRVRVPLELVDLLSLPDRLTMH